MYDYSSGYDSEPIIDINYEKSEWIISEALKYYHLFKTPPSGLCGLAVLSGNVGHGKDVIANYVDWILKEAFPTKKIIRDETPRELFGEYTWFNKESDTPLFNQVSLKEDLDKMRDLVKGTKMTMKEREAILEQAADDWVSEKGNVMLKNSVLYLTEFWRYLNLREPFSLMNKTMGGIHRVKRHLDLFILGTIQLITDLDKRNALPFIDWRIICRMSANNPTGFIGYVFKFNYNHIRGRIEMSPMPLTTIKVDGAKPITELGEPITIINDLYKGNRNEQRVIDAIESGITTFEDLKTEVKFRKREISILSILKHLFVNKIITYGCAFKIYNSKSATSI